MSDQERNTIPISICILTKNSEDKIAGCLDRLSRFEEVVVLDTGSTDGTLDTIARYPNVKVFHQDGIDNFGATRNRLTEKAKNDWVFHVDSDEFLTQDLVEYLSTFKPASDTVYAVRHRLFYRGRAIPPFDSWLRRLYNRRSTSWGLRQVHESLILDNVKVVCIPKTLEHYSFESVEQLVEKMQRYSSLYADQFHTKERGGCLQGLAHGLFTFVKHYFVRGCMWYGYDGFILAYTHSVGSLLKYAKVYERNQDIERNKARNAAPR